MNKPSIAKLWKYVIIVNLRKPSILPTTKTKLSYMIIQKPSTSILTGKSLLKNMKHLIIKSNSVNTKSDSSKKRKPRELQKNLTLKGMKNVSKLIAQRCFVLYLVLKGQKESFPDLEC